MENGLINWIKCPRKGLDRWKGKTGRVLFNWTKM